MKGAALGAVDAHERAAERVRTTDARVGCHPVIRLERSLFGRQQRQRRLERVHAEAATGRQRQLAAVDLEVVPDGVLTCALAADLLDADAQVKQLETIVHLRTEGR